MEGVSRHGSPSTCTGMLLEVTNLTWQQIGTLAFNIGSVLTELVSTTPGDIDKVARRGHRLATRPGRLKWSQSLPSIHRLDVAVQSPCYLWGCPRASFPRHTCTPSQWIQNKQTIEKQKLQIFVSFPPVDVKKEQTMQSELAKSISVVNAITLNTKKTMIVIVFMTRKEFSCFAYLQRDMRTEFAPRAAK